MRRTLTLALSAATLSLTGACTTMNGDMDDGMTVSSNDIAYVEGAAMYANKNIIENAIASPVHKTLVAAVKQADLIDTLSGPGPFTVFAPTDDAFSRVAPATVQMLMQPANKAALQKVLTYHVVPGRVTAADLATKIRAGNGTAMVRTVAGEDLTFMMKDGYVMIMGKGGSSAYVGQADVMQSNGVIHVVNGVLTPSM
ncbi:uncharacterized protein HME9302_01746 [Alteripontixanthobacter maritimus]|uniref:FAS1 domain-containing protein n=1 Tax=Alteripontixanthobacter maritimus TaxID=2161824 RepID=A0A369QAI6_9SPHN|nr:fasciclin domain-containing protein [Alteripontixanthobacter maritimus]RDC60535.1 uncharacterized protein HME9302_01746 [Alteripontixanthobacter maritimus]